MDVGRKKERELNKIIVTYSQGGEKKNYQIHTRIKLQLFERLIDKTLFFGRLKCWKKRSKRLHFLWNKGQTSRRVP